MIAFPGPVSALVTLPVPPGREGIGRVLTLEHAIHSEISGIVETVPAFNRLLILGEPRSWDPERVLLEVPELIRRVLAHPDERAVPAVTVELPACYDPELAPDLLELAEVAGLRASDVAAIHSGSEYVVLATGFAPGFAYLGDLDPGIAVPRRSSPRKRVEAGAIGIADRRTGVYPSAGPGGWQLIGRVPPSLFQDAEDRLARFEPGARVVFRPIDRASYEAEA